MSGIFDLSERVALVTGATRGLGRAMAKGLADAGASLIITGRRQERCEAAAKELAEETGKEVLGVACHMGDWEQIDALVEGAYERFGRIDVLVNNAGINPAFMPVAEITSEFFDKLYGVNVKGPMRLAALVAPRMGEAGGGSIVNVVTIGAYEGGPGIGTYSSSKAALLNFTKVMAWEWAPLKVRVNALCPGPFMTDMMKGAGGNSPGFLEAAADETLLKRIAEPEELVGAILFLASDASGYVTGEDVKVAGGMR
ncbi:MAG: SDR family oxidoreductase [Deltaproteobacteria bacterium]|nr:SDR family oxidoreductase [Deltaproteobacteria bacterium]